MICEGIIGFGFGLELVELGGGEWLANCLPVSIWHIMFS